MSAEGWSAARRIDAVPSTAAAQIHRVAADFVDLLAWQRAVGLVRAIVGLAPVMRGPGAADAVDQLMRAAESTAANVAEGYGRGRGRDGARFLRIAAASAAEAESHLRVAVACGRLPREAGEDAIARSREVRALVNGLRKALVTKGAS